MNHTESLQAALDFIEAHIKDEMRLAVIAGKAGYSAYHFSRVFTEQIGISPMNYVTWRRLQYAVHDLSLGKKVIDAAMEYGFTTHGGFTKAFARWFGFPPSLCKLRLTVGPPVKPDVHTLTNRIRPRVYNTRAGNLIYSGGKAMQPHIYEMTPFSAVGYPSRHKVENMRENVNAPTFWDTIDLDYGTILNKLYDAFPKSKHFEICMCYDADEDAGEFTYILGRGIDDTDDLKNIEPDMTRVDIAGGLYAVFSTPPAAGSFIEAAQDAWNEIFLNWLPQSEFEYDRTRRDFSYHDKRDHGWYYDGKLQIDICIPIRQREEETRKSQLRAGG